MKIDLHVHSSERSGCGRSSEEEQIQAAIRRGLDGLVFTDHHKLVPASRLAALNEKYAPFRIFGGVEISLNVGEDILVIGLQEPALEEWQWRYEDLYDLVRARGGWLALAHPYRYRNMVHLDLTSCPPDAIEGCSCNVRVDNRKRIIKLAGQLGVPVICTSDSHDARDVGEHYVEFSSCVKDEQDLIRRLKAGDFACGCKELLTQA
jgi:predicted metal-dependent phosphoesterase TrpH